MQTRIDGTCDARFAAVREQFAENFATRGEHGGAVAVFVDGECVVDLWGGWADGESTRPWEADTIVNFYSVGKGITSVCLHLLVQDGRLDVDAPVASIWPEFADAGKDAITIRQLVSHQAGLPAVRAPLHETAMLEWPTMTGALAAQPPWWTPGSAHGYHTNTFGFLAGEVIRRAAGLSVGAFLRERVAGPIGADVHIGLDAVHDPRVAEFGWPGPPPGAAGGRVATVPPAPEHSPGAEAVNDYELMRTNTYANPPGLSGGGWVNRREWRAAEIPSTNGHGSARGIAAVYAAVIGDAHRPPLLSSDVLAAAIAEQVHGPDLILGRPSRFGLGFQLTMEQRPLGPNPRAFGHFGAGGSLGFADPDAGVAFAYVMNQMGPRWQNPRNRALIDAVYDSLT